MIKTKSYKGVFFNEHVIVKAFSVFKGSAPNVDWNYSLTVEKDNGEEWRFDDISEFFRAYNLECSKAWYSASFLGREFTISYQLESTRVEVRSSDRATIDFVFDVFDTSMERLENGRVESGSERFVIATRVPERQKISYTKGLISCEVDLDLVKRLEEYILVEVPKLVGVSKQEFERSYELKISCGDYVQTLSRINSFNGNEFQDNTHRVLMKVELYGSRRGSFNMRICFDKRKYLSELAIDSERVVAREVIDGVIKKLESFIETKKSGSAIYHTEVLSFIVLNSAWIYAALIFFIWIYLGSDYSLLALVPLGLLVVYAVGHAVNPYIRFLSKREKKRKKIWDAIIKFLIVTVVLGSALAYLQKLLF